jgi:hypothetical protein
MSLERRQGAHRRPSTAQRCPIELPLKGKLPRGRLPHQLKRPVKAINWPKKASRLTYFRPKLIGLAQIAASLDVLIAGISSVKE